MKNIRNYLAARFLTTIAYQMQSVAIGWQVYALRKDPMDLGWLGLLQFLPIVVLSIPAGHLADRVEKKNVIQGVQLLWGLGTLALLFANLSGIESVGVYFVFAFVHGCLRAFSVPASQAFLPQLVEPSQFAKVVAWNASVWQASTILGPSIGGLIYGIFENSSIVYGTSGICIFFGFFLLTRVKAKLSEKDHSPASWSSVFAGVGYVWKKKSLLGALSLDLFAVLLGGAVALLPVYASDILRVGPQGLGLLRSSPGAGAIMMSLVLAWRPIQRQAGVIMFGAVVVFGMATVGFGVSHNFLLSLFLLFIMGAADVVSVVIRLTLVQMETPSEMRGRVSAVNSIFISASNELGEFESGLTARWFGVVPAVVMGGIGTILIAVFWAHFFPSLRKLQKLQ